MLPEGQDDGTEDAADGRHTFFFQSTPWLTHLQLLNGNVRQSLNLRPFSPHLQPSTSWHLPAIARSLFKASYTSPAIPPALFKPTHSVTFLTSAPPALLIPRPPHAYAHSTTDDRRPPLGRKGSVARAAVCLGPARRDRVKSFGRTK